MREKVGSAPLAESAPPVAGFYSPDLLKPRVLSSSGGKTRFRAKSPNGYKGGVSARFFARISTGPLPEHNPHLGPCWIWTGAHDGRGYGQIWHKGRSQGAYLVGYRDVACLPVPEGMELDHLCRVRACVRFDHLEPVTAKENARRSPLRWKGGVEARNARRRQLYAAAKNGRQS